MRKCSSASGGKQIVRIHYSKGKKNKSVSSQKPACKKEDTDPEIIILGNRIKKIKIAVIKLLFFFQLSYNIMGFVHCLNYFVSYILHVSAHI